MSTRGATATIATRVAAIAQTTRWGARGRGGAGAAVLLSAVFLAACAWLLAEGVGIWGVDRPVEWGFAIADYVWWIGMGMAGTFISAALLLLRQDWRASVNRFAEAMTVFAVAISGLFPILHLGRPWFFYWLAPYPNIMDLWPQWRSALTWDFFAIAAYLIVSILFWYVGMLPDLATLRDLAPTRRKRVFYGVLALGWNGAQRQWQAHATAARLLAGLAVPLVFSVHTMVALDFSEGIVPGWHSSLFGPFFVGGALFSGFAMTLLLALLLRHAFALRDLITDRDLDRLGKLLLAACLFVCYCYALETLMPFYSGNRYDIAVARGRWSGPYAWLYWLTLACNALVPQLLWSARLRARAGVLALVGVSVVAGMWLERFMLIVTSLYRAYLPDTRGAFVPTLWDFLHLFGSIGVFALLFLLFARLLPVLSVYELRQAREAVR
jgi:molybdopterin-containing oxidoreductase family membrane subunit